jgi:hypothetical protein
MKATIFLRTISFCSSLALAAILFSGCETTDSSAPPPGAGSSSSVTPTASASAPYSERYHADDGRDISIGRATPESGGWRFKEPHLDKCWIADGFNFTGYDVIYIAPTISTAKIHDDEVSTQELAKQNFVIELNRTLVAKSFFRKVVTNESAIPANARVLKLENTIVEYTKGGGAARYFVGLYGGGQPRFKMHGTLKDGDKTEFDFVAVRSGVSAGARLGGVAMKDEDIQLEDIRSFVLDLTDFMSAVAGKYTPRS